MKARTENRLQALIAEFKAGQELLAEIESRRANLQTTLTRISGAIQVLQELLDQERGADDEVLTKKNEIATGSAAH